MGFQHFSKNTLLKFTPLEFETIRCFEPHKKDGVLKFTPLEFETRLALSQIGKIRS